MPDDGVQHGSAVPGRDELTGARLPQRSHTALAQSGARLQVGCHYYYIIMRGQLTWEPNPNLVCSWGWGASLLRRSAREKGSLAMSLERGFEPNDILCFDLI